MSKSSSLRRPSHFVRAVALLAATIGAVLGVTIPSVGNAATVRPARPARVTSNPLTDRHGLSNPVTPTSFDVAVRTPHASARPTLLIYGDSVTVLSEDATRLLYGARYALVFRAFGGTSICDWTKDAPADRTTYRPARVVIAFTGNALTCSRSAFVDGGVSAWLANYQRSLLTMRRVFAGLPISVVGSPAMLGPQTLGSLHPLNGYAGLNRMYQRMCATYGMRYNASADISLTPGHVYEWQRPAFPGNGPLTLVRSADGVHVTPAGELYYGAALGA